MRFHAIGDFMSDHSAPRPDKQPVIRILFVCLGNICRSPLAEGVFRAVADEAGLASHFVVDSAGTGAWHLGSPPDTRSIAVALRYGVDISAQKARRIAIEDFRDFDLILGMDRSNVDDVRRLSPGDADKVQLFLDHAGIGPYDVPDPYYDRAEGFENVYRMIREASEALIARLDARASAPASGQTSSTT